MNKYLLPIFLLLLFAPAAFAQSTTVSGTFTDSNSQALAYGAWTLKFSPSPSSPSGPYSWNGSPFNIQTSYTGSLNSSGAMTGFSIQSTNFITPTGNSWSLTVCPAATVNCSSGNVVITGSTQSLSSAITIPAIQVQANTSNQAAAYSDAEIQGAIPGYVYWNITSSTLRVCAGPLPCTWTAVGGGGGGGVTAVIGTSPIVSSGGTTPAISCPTCNTSSASIGGTTSASHLAYSTGADTLSDVAGSSANSAGNITLAPPATGVGVTVTIAPDGSDGIICNGGVSINEGCIYAATTGGVAVAAGSTDTNGASGFGAIGLAGQGTQTDSTGSGFNAFGVYPRAFLRGTNVTGDSGAGVQAYAEDLSTGGAAAEVNALWGIVKCTARSAGCYGVHIPAPLAGSVAGVINAGVGIDSQGGLPAIVTAPADPSTLGLLTAATVTDSALTSGRCVQAGTAGLLGNAAGACVTSGTAGTTINGVSYSNLYTGTTLDVRANACITDAETLANGNTSGICDSSGEGGAQTIAAQINVGDAGGDPVTWILPARGVWTSTISNSTSSIIFQYTLSRIIGKEPLLRLEIEQANAGLYSMYANNGSGYYRLANIDFYNTTYTMVSGHVVYISGGLDESSWDFEAADYNSSDSSDIYVTGVCCTAHLSNITAGGNYTGPMALDIEGSNGIVVESASLGHPKAGQPNLKIGSGVTATFTGTTYFEGNTSDTTTALIQIAGATSVHFDTIEAKAETASSTAAVISMTSAYATSLTVDNFSASSDPNWTLPLTVVSDSTPNCPTAPCLTLSDSHGNLTGYESVKHYARDYYAYNGFAGNIFAGTYFDFTETATAQSPTTGYDYCRGNSSTHAIDCSFNGGAETPLLTGSATVGIPAVQNITAVTVAANSTSAQLLQELTLTSGLLNNLNQTYLLDAAGVYTDGAAQTPTLTFAAYLCTTSGCGSSGTLIFSQTTGATTTASGDPWRISGVLVNSAIGGSGQLYTYGTFKVDLGAGALVAQTVYQTAPALTAALNLAQVLYIDFTVTTSTGSTGNSITQSVAVLAPQSNPTLSGTIVSAPFFATTTAASASALTANKIQLYGFYLPYQVTFSKITYNIIAADNTSNLYDLGIYSSTGSLLCDEGATAGTTFAPSANATFTLTCTQGTITLSAGNYYVGVTAVTATATVGGASGVLTFSHTGTIVTSGGALPGTITPPSASYVISSMFGVLLHQ